MKKKERLKSQSLLADYKSQGRNYTVISLSITGDWNHRPGTTGTTGNDTMSGTPQKADDCDQDHDDDIIVLPKDTLPV